VRDVEPRYINTVPAGIAKGRFAMIVLKVPKG